MAYWLTEGDQSQVTRWHIGLQRGINRRSQDGTLTHRGGSIADHKMVHWLTEVGRSRSQDGTLAHRVGSIAGHKMAHWLTEVGRLQVTRWSIGSLRWVDHRSQDGPLAH